jgi:hypothetical protein
MADYANELATYGVFGDAFAVLIGGNMLFGASELNVPTEISFANTAIYSCPDVRRALVGSPDAILNGIGSCRGGSVERAIEDLSRNLTLSMFTVPELM